MASRYSIVQYVPNPIADERINIGVVAFDDHHVRVQFLNNWSRVQTFGREDIHFLRDFAKQMNKAAGEGLLFPGDRPDDTPKHERLTKIARDWINSIQFTEPRGSLENVDSLLEDIAQTYLVNLVSEKEPRGSLENVDSLLEDTAQTYLVDLVSEKIKRNRQDAARITNSLIRKTILSYNDRPALKEMLKNDFLVRGSHKEHKFDVVMANGQPYFAAHGISFEVQSPESIKDSISWMISDVKESNYKLPIGIVALPPKQESPDYKKLNEMYQKTTSTYRSLGAEVLQEDEVQPWASHTIESAILSA
ncbi:DUF3037 domain-containing protein [Kamptonema animale CS-326]|jgi:hypothetical protein|uniref:DUF3037 domain-containing protein n=1 Tax=Kamptonema animale TaxID=92934 RepID=UPI00232EE4B6|nr:DUF3037 domain-containing protein [Kamptonema animale]MDB9511888.1 DUF3037 domain-containing protein [Kamptonema animale CS-326]